MLDTMTSTGYLKENQRSEWLDHCIGEVHSVLDLKSWCL